MRGSCVKWKRMVHDHLEHMLARMLAPLTHLLRYALLSFLTRSAAHIQSFAHSVTLFKAHEKEEFMYRMRRFHSNSLHSAAR